MPVIGYLATSTPEGGAASFAAFRKGLAEAGFVEGRNVAIDLRWMNSDFGRIPELLTDLLRRSPSLLFVGTPPGVRAAMAATKTIPIVFMVGEDPVKEGLVPSLNRPGGNVTGFSDFANQLAGKRLGLLHDAVPKVTSIAFLVDAHNPNAAPDTKDMQDAAAARGIELPVFSSSENSDFERVFREIAQQRVGALIVNTAPRFFP